MEGLPTSEMSSDPGEAPGDGAGAQSQAAPVSLETLHDAPVGVYRSTAEGRLLYANRALAALHGYASPGDICAGVRSMADDLYADPRDRERLWDMLCSAGEVRNFECRARRLDGSTLWVSINSRLMLLPCEGPCAEGFVIDIDARKRDEERLAHSEEQFRSLAEAAADGIVTVDEQGTVVFVNRAAAQLLDHDPEDMMGRGLSEVLPGRLGPLHQRLFDRDGSGPESAQGGKTVEAAITWLDGRQAVVQLSLTTWQACGRTYHTAILRDQTRALESRRALEHSEGQLRLLADNVRDMIWIADAGFGLQYVTPSVSEMLGYSPEEFAAKGYENILAPESLPAVRAALAELLAGEPGGTRPVRRVWNQRCVHKNGSLVDVETVTRTVHDGNGEFAGVVGVTRDVTARRRMEAELHAARDKAEAASRAKSEFLANTSHEVRTPLNGILGVLQLLADSPLSAEQREQVDLALSAGRTLLRILNDILDLSRIEAGKLEILEEPFSPVDTLAAVNALFASAARDKGLELRVGSAVAPDAVYMGDAGRIRQVLFNLAGNAIKFTSRGAVAVSVSALRHPSDDGRATLLFEVADTGPGIPKDRLDDCFEPFTQLDGSHTRRHGGAGLGLAIVRRLVERMGGSLNVVSEPRQGTAVSFGVPVRVSRPTSAPAGVAAPLPDQGSLRILVVEDERINLLMLQRFLTNKGHAVTCAVNGLEAVAACERGRFDCIIMDVQMPGMGGLEATRRILHAEAAAGRAAPPILALTAHAYPADHKEFLAAGMRVCLSKPVDLGGLLAVIHEVAGRQPERRAPGV